MVIKKDLGLVCTVSTQTGNLFKIDDNNILHSQCCAKNIAVYAFFSGKIQRFRNLAGVKHLTNSMSASESKG